MLVRRSLIKSVIATLQNEEERREKWQVFCVGFCRKEKGQVSFVGEGMEVAVQGLGLAEGRRGRLSRPRHGGAALSRVLYMMTWFAFYQGRHLKRNVPLIVLA